MAMKDYPQTLQDSIKSFSSFLKNPLWMPRAVKDIDTVIGTKLQPKQGTGVLPDVPIAESEQRIGQFKEIVDAFHRLHLPSHPFTSAINSMYGLKTPTEVNAQVTRMDGNIVRQIGLELTSQFRGVDNTISEQALQDQADFQAQAKKQLEDIEKGTVETYERGLYGGQTIQEIASAQRAKRLGYVTEGANQQKAALYAQNQFSQQQEQMQGRQDQLRTQQLTGARGIGGSSVEDQILASQQQQVVSQQAKSQEKLGQGLFTINKQTSKQSAEINAEINKDMQQRQTDAQNAFDVKNKQAKQKILDQQQADILKVQHEYQTKRTEIDKLISQVNAMIGDL